MKQKKGQVGESIVWLYRFLMIIIVIGLLIFAVIRNYSLAYDIRPLEASFLAKKILNCLDKEIKEERIKNCILLDDEIFIELNLTGKEEKNLSLGNSNLKVYCEAKEKGIKGKNLPYCFRDTYFFDQQNNLTLTIAILKLKKNV